MKHGIAYFLEGVGFLTFLWVFLWTGAPLYGLAMFACLVLLVLEVPREDHH